MPIGFSACPGQVYYYWYNSNFDKLMAEAAPQVMTLSGWNLIPLVDISVRAQEPREGQGGCPGLPVPNSLYSLCGCTWIKQCWTQIGISVLSSYNNFAYILFRFRWLVNPLEPTVSWWVDSILETSDPGRGCQGMGHPPVHPCLVGVSHTVSRTTCITMGHQVGWNWNTIFPLNHWMLVCWLATLVFCLLLLLCNFPCWLQSSSRWIDFSPHILYISASLGIVYLMQSSDKSQGDLCIFALYSIKLKLHPNLNSI